MTIRAAIVARMIEIAEQQKRPLAPLTDDLPLLESGLDSLCLALLVSSLDDELELDPFGGDNDVELPVTVGDFVRLYENAAASSVMDRDEATATWTT